MKFNMSKANGQQTSTIHPQPFATLDLRFRTSEVETEDQQMSLVLRGVKELLDDAYHLGVNKGRHERQLRVPGSTPTFLCDSKTFMKDGSCFIRHLVDMRGMDLRSITVVYKKADGELFLAAKYPAKVIVNNEVNVSI